MYFNELEKKGLITQYYRCANFVICRVADWAILAFLTKGEDHYSGGEVSDTTYYGWQIDREFARKIMENNAVFIATLLSNQTSRNPDFRLSTRDGYTALEAIRNEVRNGTRKNSIDPMLEKDLKRVHLKALESLVQTYGNPPVFSKKKFSSVMLSFFLYPFGLPWFMVGNKKAGWLHVGVFFVAAVGSIAFMPQLFVAMALIVINVFVFYFKLFAGKIKDSQGLPILTKAKQKQITDRIKQYNDYARELGV